MNRILLLMLAFCFTLTLCGTAWSQAIMRPDEATLHRWIDDYENAPRAFLDKVIWDRLNQAQAEGLGTSIDLLNYLEYTPNERDQGNCGDCWVWASTGVAEIALNVQEGIKKRLSIQLLQSCKTDDYACCGGNANDFADWYQGRGMMVPWSNRNASFQDGWRGCEEGWSLVSCGNISTTPNYAVTSIQPVTIPTTAVGQSTAISNLKNVLHQNKGVYYAFWLANNADWNVFQTQWSNYGETNVWNPDPYCGHTWVNGEGAGHAVLIVGYNDDDPANSYWIALNSWGTADGKRPNGLFRMPMSINYDCTLYDPSAGENFHSQQFMTFDVTFDTQPSPTQTPNLIPFQPSGWSDKIVVSNETGTNGDNSPLKASDSLYVDFAVLNDSSVPINQSFYTTLYVDGVLKSAWYFDYLAGRNHVSVTDCSIGSLGAGTHSIRIVVDSTGTIAETNETDNEYTRTITIEAETQIPNLSLYQPKGWSDKVVVSNSPGTSKDSTPLRPTDTLWVDFAIINDSGAPIDSSFSVALYIDGILKNSWSWNSLDAGSYVYVTDYPIGSLDIGTHSIKIVLDSTGAVAETHEGDNEYTKVIAVEGNTSEADLMIGFASFANSCTGPSCKISAIVEIDNVGSRDAPSTYTEMYLYDAASGDFTLVKRSPTPSIKKGDYKILRISASLPTGEKGSGRYIAVFADADDILAESDEDNNLVWVGPLP